MVITSMDINNKEFKKNFRGYDCDEVDEFLDKIAEDYEALYKENSFAKERLEVAEEKLKHYSKIEENIQKTLVLAQSAAEQAKTSAQNEAELIIRQASESAQRIINKAHNDVIRINDDYEAVKQEFLKFRAKFKHFMSAQLDTFSGLEKEFVKNYNVGNAVDLSDISAKEIQINNEIPSVDNLESVNKKNLTQVDITKDATSENEGLNNEDLDAIKSFFAEEDVK
ncbi:DivIVA domain-containing protein [Clostridium botulinum]|uniref:DivIVA domain-containing protein n=1 Tax=Clostridium botulinum TaxID=1491 RepID=UPI0004D3AC78|nr:DivIVA domain-containing protein [Clostridium botulinum]KEI02120.1 cell division protein DivIVA [Clostridium botulinum C/D str. BKT75002]KEI09456.1 cell division protein DivIVA [Clostridium botulinum C/D str. BKT2873]KGM96656.1 cell division protein DivIVA [Clostridium botulinum D str. CCUG 7971]KOC48534.1 cell division protein DivIVA [Clostridium botulinum]MCD3350210.1 DivIVA domain-containing protein [Clostridium botulinum D/C]